MSRILALLTALALAASLTALTACGSDATSSSDTTTAKVGGTAVCDKDSIAKAVSASGTAEGTTAKLSSDGFTCEAGWAVALADVGPANVAVTETLLYRAEGQFWVPQDRGKVCPKPSDVPAAIYRQACETN